MLIVLSTSVPGIEVCLKLLHGELAQVREENPLLFKNVSLTKKFGFPDVIMPGDVRFVALFYGISDSLSEVSNHSIFCAETICT